MVAVTGASAAMQDADPTIAIVEEHLVVGKRSVPRRRLRIETRTEEVEERIGIDLASDEVTVERVPVGREIEVPPAIRTEGQTTIIPILEEEVVITRRLILKEELHVTRRSTARQETRTVSLRRQRAIISHEPVTQFPEEGSMTDTATNPNLTAFFDTRAEADAAAERLRAIGVPAAGIRITGGEGFADRAPEAYQERGFWASIADFFFPDDERATYAEGLRRGGFIVTVSHVPPDRHDEAVDILEEEGSVDLDERSGAWRAEGWDETVSTASRSDDALGTAATAGMAGTAAAAASATGAMKTEDEKATAYDVDRLAATARTGTRDEDSEVIPVMEESLRVGKRDVNLGRVRVRSYVVETPATEDVTLREEHVTIDRRPVDRPLTGDEAAFRDRVIEAEEHAEEAVVSKEARVTEEISLRRTAEEHTETISETVRHTEVEIEDERRSAEEMKDRLKGKPVVTDKPIA